MICCAVLNRRPIQCHGSQVYERCLSEFMHCNFIPFSAAAFAQCICRAYQPELRAVENVRFSIRP
jgi:hypothetical protein